MGSVEGGCCFTPHLKALSISFPKMYVSRLESKFQVVTCTSDLCTLNVFKILFGISFGFCVKKSTYQLSDPRTQSYHLKVETAQAPPNYLLLGHTQCALFESKVKFIRIASHTPHEHGGFPLTLFVYEHFFFFFSFSHWQLGFTVYESCSSPGGPQKVFIRFSGAAQSSKLERMIRKRRSFHIILSEVLHTHTYKREELSSQFLTREGS